jgi:hypothetical protein
MSKLTLIFAGVFTVITVFAIATDLASPAGYSTTPKINKTKNVRDRSVYVGGRHRGFRSGK